MATVKRWFRVSHRGVGSGPEAPTVLELRSAEVPQQGQVESNLRDSWNVPVKEMKTPPPLFLRLSIASR